MTPVFISHSNKDDGFVSQLARDLAAAGVETWVDHEDIQPGESWPRAVERALESCEAMILVLSPDSATSENVEVEWNYFLEEGKDVYPVVCTACKVPFRLRLRQRVDFTSHAAPLDELLRVLTTDTFTPAPKLLRIEDILPPPFEWVEIPAGSVTLEDESERHGTEGGVYTVPGFAITKYPITNAQYEVFVRYGYSDPRWWDYSVEAKAWREAHPQAEATAFEGADLPRTNVCWYEAVAFCRWLSEQTGQNINLPTEQQWQRAAQGDDERTYPWGNKFDKRCCNIESRSPVSITQFSKGASPYGVMDMSGNVWEWCLTEWGTDTAELKGDNRRVVRGGSWFFLRHYARAGYRDRNHPDIRNNNFGFRVARVPSE